MGLFWGLNFDNKKISPYRGINPPKRTGAVLSPCPAGNNKPGICSWVPSSFTHSSPLTTKHLKKTQLAILRLVNLPLKHTPIYKYLYFSLSKNKTMAIVSKLLRPVSQPYVSRVFFLLLSLLLCPLLTAHCVQHCWPSFSSRVSP